MAKIINCPACQGRMGVPDEFRGGRLLCPTCKHAFQMPAPSPTTAAVSASPAASAPATNKITCPACQATKSVPASFAGGSLKCPTCGHQFRWAPPAARPAAPAPPSTGERAGVRANPSAARPSDPTPRLRPTAPGGRGEVRSPTPAAASPHGGLFDDVEDDEPVHQLPASQLRSTRTTSSDGGGIHPMVWVGSAVGGVALLVVIAAVALRPGSPEPPPSISVPPQGEVSLVPAPPSALAQPLSPPVIPPVLATARNSAEVVRELSEATVYVTQRVNGRLISTGTGFVVEARGGNILLATNKHVAVMELDELPSSLVGDDPKVTTEVVFHSGQGRQREQVVPATLVAADMSQEMSNDIAFLSVSGVKNPPKPINLEQLATPEAGMRYIGAGFPLGGKIGEIAESKSNPSVTITRGGIASLRNDDFEHVSILQVDGSLQGGNSGGPLVDEASGRLIGMAVAKISSVDTIGFAIPAAEIRRTLKGTIGAFNITRNASAPGIADVLVEAQIVDPKAQVKSVVVHVAPVAAVKNFAPNSDGTWPPLPNSQPVEMTIQAEKGVASGRVQATIAANNEEGRKIYVQTAHRDTTGNLVYGRPRVVPLPEGAGRVRPEGALAKVMEGLRVKSMAKLGDLIDPDQDCHMNKDEQQGQVKISVPGKLHTLSPAVTKQKQPINNAPRAMATVKGDFAAVVAVVGKLNPNATPAAVPNGFSLPKGKKLDFTFQGAGLLLYEDPNNHVRIERAARVDAGKLTHHLLIEVVKNGKQAVNPLYLNLPFEKDMLLIMIRRDNRLRFMFSPDGRTIIAFEELVFDFPEEIQVGLTASNASTKAMEAVFEGFTLMDDSSKIDEEFGAE